MTLATGFDPGKLITFTRGEKVFELSNQLGNSLSRTCGILVTISDRKILVKTGSGSESNGGCDAGTAAEELTLTERGTATSLVAKNRIRLLPGFSSGSGDSFTAYIDNSRPGCELADNPTANPDQYYYIADVISANDYYPGGMQMAGRKYSSNDSYRYGFNGKENDDEISGEGNKLDFGARIYDARLVRWLSVDPLQYKYPGLTPYNFVANSPLNAVDPDGKLIIFINGLWGPPMGVGKGGTVGYWGAGWVQRTQDAIGDHKDPLYYDGSMGGTMHFGGKSSLYEKNRIAAGKAAGYKDGKAIIDKLDKDETIKIVTNSMGAAFERGFSEGLLKYRDERINAIGGELFLAGLQKSDLERKIGADRVKALNQGILIEPQTELEKQYRNITNKITVLNNEKEKLQKVEIEMVIDLSAHQTDYANPNANANYYMTAEENITYGESLMGVDEKKHIRRSTYLGKMGGHHSSWADPNKFPKAKKPN